MYTDEEKAAILAEYDQRRANKERSKDIEANFKSRGIPRTFQNWRTQAKKAQPTPPKETPMSVDETPVEVLPGQMSIEDADTPAKVRYGAVHEVDALPDGYAKTIQPMQPYSDAEEWALNKSMELYGFLGAVVRDQYGRILDGNQRERVARLRGLAVPHTITLVRDDAHAIEIARTLNTVRRHYTKEQREELAPRMRDQGFTYEAIAEALGVGKATVYRDVLGVLRVRTEPSIVPNETTQPENNSIVVPKETINGDGHDALVSNETIKPVTHESPTKPAIPVARVKRKGGGTYPAQRSPEAQQAIAKGQAEATRERLSERGQPNHNWINVLSQAHRLSAALCRLPEREAVFESWGTAGRQKAIDYLSPLSDEISQLIGALHAIDATPLETE